VIINVNRSARKERALKAGVEDKDIEKALDGSDPVEALASLVKELPGTIPTLMDVGDHDLKWFKSSLEAAAKSAKARTTVRSSFEFPMETTPHR